MKPTHKFGYLPVKSLDGARRETTKRSGRNTDSTRSHLILLGGIYLRPDPGYSRSTFKFTGSSRLYRAAPPTPPGWAPRSIAGGSGMQLQSKRTDNFEDGVEAWATLAGKRLVKAFAG